MSDIQVWLQSLLAANGMDVAPARKPALEQFAAAENNKVVIEEIFATQQMLMNKWKLHSRIMDVREQATMIPNGTVGKPYEAVIDFEELGWGDLTNVIFTGLEDIGLQYDPETKKISGTPIQSGDLKFCLNFKIAGEAEDNEPHEKAIPLIINPDPKSLWKEIESDREAPFWKEDNLAVADKLGDKHIVVASKRGRSHANAGTFRDDDFAYRHFEDTGWSVIAVSDGAGSAAFSREGARLACQTVIDYFAVHLGLESFAAFDELIAAHHNGNGEDTPKRLNEFLYNNLGKAALAVHKKIAEAAALKETDIRDFHATLIFALIRKYEFGYAVLTFGVGDCPIAIVQEDPVQVTLMNKLDVGEYGGGTRFITMPEIFRTPQFATRFGFRIVPDFSYLMLMTDGIYDPKFAVEAALEKPEKWQEFISDLKGNNETGAAVDFTPGNPDIGTQLSGWMDFWSPGNHDDRTLAIVY